MLPSPPQCVRVGSALVPLASGFAGLSVFAGTCPFLALPCCVGPRVRPSVSRSQGLLVTGLPPAHSENAALGSATHVFCGPFPGFSTQSRPLVSPSALNRHRPLWRSCCPPRTHQAGQAAGWQRGDGTPGTTAPVPARRGELCSASKNGRWEPGGHGRELVLFFSSAGNGLKNQRFLEAPTPHGQG